MSHIITEAKDRVLRIEIARPDKKNALTLDMYKAMADALAAADGDPAVRVVLIHGARDCFTAGNDLKDFLERPPHSEASPTTRFLRGIATFGKPLLAAVNGAAVGIGTPMLLHCDLVYAAPGARFQMPFRAARPGARGGLELPVALHRRLQAPPALLLDSLQCRQGLYAAGRHRPSSPRRSFRAGRAGAPPSPRCAAGGGATALMRGASRRALEAIMRECAVSPSA
jgi:enoyl-CoA hydratase/carnithine racemase